MNSKKLRRPKMFLQPRPNDKNIVLAALGHFDGFHVGASLPAHLVNFVQGIGKPFFVDPMAYKFALSPEQIVDKEKRSVPAWLKGLAHRYGPVFEKAIGHRAITTGDMELSKEIPEQLTEKSLEYQRMKFQATEPELFNKYYDKYDAVESEGTSMPHKSQGTTPALVVPPFFMADSVHDPWYQVNLRCAEVAALRKRPEELLYGVIFLDKEALLQLDVVTVVKDYSDRQFTGIALWVNGLSEESASPELLANLLRLVEAFRSIGKVVIKLNGGYFSILMNHVGLSGFSCGLTSRTSRDIKASKFILPGPPKARFYIPGLHQAYPLAEAEQIISNFPSLRCSCRICREAYGNDIARFATEMKKDQYCEKHFLNVRRAELEAYSKDGLEGALEQVDAVLTDLKRRNAKGARHLSKWCDVMRGIPGSA